MPGDRAQAELMTELLGLSKRLERAWTAPAVVQALLPTVEQTLGYPHCWLAVLGDQPGFVTVVSHASFDGRDSDLLRKTDMIDIPISGDPFLAEILKADHIVVVEEAKDDPRTNKEVVAALGNRTIINVPLVVAQGALGTLGIGTFGDEGVRVPQAWQLDFLQAVASHVAVALDRVKFLRAREVSEAHERELERQLDQAQKYESLGLLAGGIAHDMNNLLAAISALAAVRQRSPQTDPESRAAFDTIQTAVDRGRSMVKGILDFTRAGMGTQERVVWNDIVREQLNLLTHTTLAQVELEADLAEGLPEMVGNSAALGQVLMNLCVNAVDAMEASDRPARMAIRTTYDDGSVSVVVVDNGIGMDPETLARATEPLFTTKQPGKGTGLGLSQTDRIVRAHGGSLQIRSTLGQGTEVRVTFPLSTEAGPTEAPVEPTLADVQNTRILLVDDDDLVRLATHGLLESLGARPSSVSRAEAAVGMLEAGLDCDVVMLDVNMPGLGGVAAVGKVRALRPNLAIVLTTGLPDQRVLEQVGQSDRTHLLVKPFTLHELQVALSFAE